MNFNKFNKNYFTEQPFRMKVILVSDDDRYTQGMIFREEVGEDVHIAIYDFMRYEHTDENLDDLDWKGYYIID